MKHYTGGKLGAGTYQQIINHIPQHSIYVAPFAGHDGIYRKKRPALITVLNDIDEIVISTWKIFLKKSGIDYSIDFIQGNLFEKPNTPVVILRNNDYSVIVDRFKNNPDAFIYCDPPYPMDKRLQQERLYRFDWETDEQHLRFLRQCITCKCAVAISSFPNDLYDRQLDGWEKAFYYTTLRNGKRQKECLYMNYPAPIFLHDFQYLGKNYRERENIKAKTKRHIARLGRMPAIERIAIISAIIQQYKEAAGTLIKL